MHSTPVPPCPETDVVVIGEAIIDIINTAAGPVEFPGGSGMNVAFGLGRLGVSTAFLTALGRDERSRNIQQHLDTAGVHLFPGAEHLSRTSTARALLDSSGSAEYEFDFEWNLPHISPLSSRRCCIRGHWPPSRSPEQPKSGPCWNCSPAAAWSRTTQHPPDTAPQPH
ncbi:fructokinase [Arthrobacter sp. Hiyo8]|nr:fructokinase [Arthrobacter sp. Hiyo8]